MRPRHVFGMLRAFTFSRFMGGRLYLLLSCFFVVPHINRPLVLLNQWYRWTLPIGIYHVSYTFLPVPLAVGAPDISWQSVLTEPPVLRHIEKPGGVMLILGLVGVYKPPCGVIGKVMILQ